MNHNPDNIHLPEMPLPPELPADEDAGRWLNLDDLLAIKWGDKILDPREVSLILRPQPPV
jgi:hypothetical protein